MKFKLLFAIVLVPSLFISAIGKEKTYETGFVWDASHLSGAKSTNPDADKLGTKAVWHYLYTIAKAEHAEKYGRGFKPFERSYGKRKYFLDLKLPIGEGNPCIRTTDYDFILEFKSSRFIKPVTLGWQSPVDGTVTLKATVVAEGEARFEKGKGMLTVLLDKKKLHQSKYEPGKGDNILVENITVKKGDFVYISVLGNLYIGDIGFELLDAQ